MNIMDTITNTLSSKGAQDNHAVVPIPERLKKNERIIIITDDNAEDTEFFYPYYRLTEAGYDVDVVTMDGGPFECKHGLGLSASKSIREVRAQNYVLLYLPGGKAPAELREDDAVLAFVKEFAISGRPIAAICHGPQLLVSAGLVRGRQIAAWPEVREEIEKAGGTYVDEALVIDGPFITARKPGDLHRHLWGVMQYLEGKIENKGRAERKASAA